MHPIPPKPHSIKIDHVDALSFGGADTRVGVYMAQIRQHTVTTPYMVGDVHFYSTEIEGELVLFDTGPPTEKGLAELRRSVDLARVRHVFITHAHVDHYGLAGYIEQESNAQIYLPRMDAFKLQHLDERRAGLSELLYQDGFDDAFTQALNAVSVHNRGSFARPSRYCIVEESEAVLKKLGISYLACPGHSQSDLVYLCQGCALTGDLLLRNVFQAPSLEFDLQRLQGRFANYQAYCASIVKLATLEGTTILPGHHLNVDGASATIVFYVRKLMQRAAKVKLYADTEKVSEVLKLLFGNSLTETFISYLKASEVHFMRDFLADPSRLKEALVQIGLFDPVQELYEEVTG